MDKTVRKFDSFEAMKDDEYREWQAKPAHERVSAISEITEFAYRLKDPSIDVRRLQRTLVRLQWPPR
jgi:hypothetical protein